jgi:hypothetical protein
MKPSAPSGSADFATAEDLRAPSRAASTTVGEEHPFAQQRRDLVVARRPGTQTGVILIGVGVFRR